MTTRSVAEGDTAVIKAAVAKDGLVRLSIWEKPIGTTEEHDDTEIAFILLNEEKIKVLTDWLIAHREQNERPDHDRDAKGR